MCQLGLYFNRVLCRIVEDILPGVEIQPDLMSFEGLWVDTVTMANLGVNTQVS